MRVKSGVRTKRRHNKVLKLAKGYWQSRSSQFKKAAEAVLHAGQYAYAGRRIKRRDFRSLWIVRINAAVRPEGLSYSQFVSKLKAKNISLDRKILSQIATEYPNVFKKIVSEVK
ncbi:MAG: 50S ribosomal protein L20 [Microgenomates group bacterium]|jgi:large subunit ribosomal protein L20|nr:50S ribosomal protein L20 [Candidatus Woesebacteria bacterium]MBP6883539.1 50S ribosomal protein L20 [Candidatus Woesebacteria bacterium]QQR64290.1 MAG: 50S ribosomal protein L20 [Candidatus Roizmanbacteria bacterium]